MKLRYTPTSPYVRKVMVCAAETGSSGDLELIPTDLRDPESDLPGDNPLGKVPTLITDDGDRLFDSPVICEYLDGLHDGDRLYPSLGAARWTALRLQALGDGILDAAVLCMLEGRREPGERSAAFVAHQKGKIERALDALESEAAGLGGRLTIGAVTAGCALGHLDFRRAEDRWREGRPALAAWYEAFSRRPSMAASAPRDPA